MSLHKLLIEAAGMLQMSPPDMYIRQVSFLNSPSWTAILQFLFTPCTFYSREAVAECRVLFPMRIHWPFLDASLFIVLHTALLELLTPGEVQVL